MVMEDGKYYPMMRVHFDASAVSHADSFTEEQELEFRYGKQLLTEKHPVLLAYLRWEVQIQQDILTQLSGQPATADCRPDRRCKTDPRAECQGACVL